VSDVIDGGSRGSALPRWAWVVAGVLALAALIIVVATRNGPHHSVSARPKSSPLAPQSNASTPSDPGNTQLATASAAEWPTAAGACGSNALLPQRSLALHYGNVDGTVLVGGASLQTVTLGQPSTSPVRGGPGGNGMFVDTLVAAPDAAYAQVAACGATTGGTGTLYRIEAGVARPLAASGDQWLVGGAHHGWAVRYPLRVTASDGVPTNPGPTLTPLDGGRTITLATNAYLFADTTAGMVVGVDDPVNPEAPPSVEVVDVGTAKAVRTWVGGSLKAAQGRSLIVQTGSCGATPTPPGPCSLQRLDLITGQETGDYPLPAGRSPVSTAIFSPNGKVIAFQLARSGHDARFATDFPPSDIAILHLDTGRLSIVPNLEFAPKTGVGLAFDATGASVLATVNDGDHGELLIWQEGMTGAALVTSIPGPLDAPPPILLALR
jgi:hypothetical protein